MRTIKRLFIAGLTVLVALGLWSAPVAAGESPYRIGALLEVTGGLSFLGEPARNTITMIVDEINAAGGINGHPIELTVYDTEGKPTRAVTSAQKLIKRDKVAAILGPLSSGSCLAVMPIVAQAEIPHMAMGASRKIIEPPQKWVFNTVQTDRNAAARIFAHMRDQGITRVGLITVSNGFGDSGRDQLLALAPEYGVEIVADEKFGEKDSDTTAQLTSIQRSDAQAVQCWTVGPTQAIVTKNWKQLAMTIPLYQSHGAASKQFLAMTGDAGEGIIFPAPKLIIADQLPADDPQRDILIAYRDAYEARFQQPVSKFGGNAHDAIRIVAAALDAVGPDPAKIRDYVERLQGHLGVVGLYNYSPDNHNGLTKDYFVMIQVENGNWKLLQ